MSAPRQCRYCHCTAAAPCTLANGDECAFLGAAADRCSNPACVVAFERDCQLRSAVTRRGVQATVRRLSHARLVERRRRLGQMAGRAA